MKKYICPIIMVFVIVFLAVCNNAYANNRLTSFVDKFSDGYQLIGLYKDEEEDKTYFTSPVPITQNTPVSIEGTVYSYHDYQTRKYDDRYSTMIISEDDGFWLAFLDFESDNSSYDKFLKLEGRNVRVNGIYKGFSKNNDCPVIQVVEILDYSDLSTSISRFGIKEKSHSNNDDVAKKETELNDKFGVK